MTDFYASWQLSRGRLDETVLGLGQAQLNWRIHPDALTIGEMALHVAGVELYFWQQLTGGSAPDPRVAAAATQGVVNSDPFPIPAAEITPKFVESVLRTAREIVGPMIESPTPEILKKEIKSALGPMIDGYGALSRLAFHPGYHHGQAYLILTAPGFPGTDAVT